MTVFFIINTLNKKNGKIKTVNILHRSFVQSDPSKRLILKCMFIIETKRNKKKRKIEYFVFKSIFFFWNYVKHKKIYKNKKTKKNTFIYVEATDKNNLLESENMKLIIQNS